MTPPLFRPLNVQQALEAAKAEGKLVLIDFSAEWCAPCQTMDKSTWVAAPVVEWVGQNAVAIQVDVDKQKEEAQPFGVQAMPTMVLLKDGAELDRTTGGRNAVRLLEWLKNAKDGKTELDTTREALPDDDPSAWFHFARMLEMRGKHDEAMEQLERCWFQAVKVAPGWIGVKHSFLANALHGIAERSEKAKARISSWRDAAEQKLTEPESLADWLTLNQVLADGDRVLAWFDTVKAAPPPGLELSKARVLIELLKKAGRWEDYGRLLAAPLDELTQLALNFSEQQQHFGKQHSAEEVEMMRTMMSNMLREQARAMVKALRAAGRADEALRLEAKAVELDPTDEMRDALATA